MPEVAHLHRDPERGISKDEVDEVVLVPGLGVEGDVHFGPTVQHRSRRRGTTIGPNLRQVHLLAGELHDELRAAGFSAGPGALGENVTTRGIDLPSLPAGTTLRLGESALVALTGLRTPCRQIEDLEPGLLAAVQGAGPGGKPMLCGGVMAVVVVGGPVRRGDPIEVALPPGPPVPLAPV